MKFDNVCDIFMLYILYEKNILCKTYYMKYTYLWPVSSSPHVTAELKVGIFARREMVDQAREGLCYQ